jgi:bifunctional DNase/RNase
MLEVELKGVSITDIGFVIFLKNIKDERVLPIFIGPVEAQAISLALMNRKPARPMTHDLFRMTIEAIEYEVLKVEITEFKDPTYFANLFIQNKKYIKKGSEKTLMIIDSRPSDAIALALRFNCPIFVAEELIEEHGIIIKDNEQKKTKSGSIIKTKPVHEGAIDKKVNEQLGVYEKMLQQAIKEERFEDASRLKKQIEELTGSQN